MVNDWDHRFDLQPGRVYRRESDGGLYRFIGHRSPSVDESSDPDQGEADVQFNADSLASELLFEPVELVRITDADFPDTFEPVDE